MKIHAPIRLYRSGKHHHWAIYSHCGRNSSRLVGDALRRRGAGKTARLSRWIIRWFGDYRTYEAC